MKYANQRHIRVIPEIETPGHARAAIKSMDVRYDKYMKEGNKEAAEQYLLRNYEDTSHYRSNQGFNDNVMDAALPSTYRFVEKVITEIQTIYKEAGAPLTAVHMAGDEVPHGAWENHRQFNHLCKKIRALKTQPIFGKIISEK